MGRGRAKAKHTRKARELKYSSPGLDAAALQRELSADSAFRSDDPKPDRGTSCGTSEYTHHWYVEDEHHR